MGHSWGTKQKFLGHSWGIVGAQLGKKLLGHSWGTVEAKPVGAQSEDIYKTLVKLKPL